MSSNKLSNTKILAFFGLILLCCVLFSLHKHRTVEQNNFRTELWADRAGYYIYLPSTFIYAFSANKINPELELSTGGGFKVNQDQKIETKYTYGVALMEAPFFLVADLITAVDGRYPRDGFSFYYRKLIDISGSFYFVFGLFFLFLVLRKLFLFNDLFFLLILGLIGFGTNLYYYGLIEGGMSHIYSFFLSSLLIYLTLRFLNKPQMVRYKFLLFITIALISLIRPINILFVGTIIFLNVESRREVVERLRLFFNVKSILLFLLAFLIIWLPQFLYWRYLSGHFILYSYNSENFDHLLSPRILEVLFSPNNGLLPYSLLFIFIFPALIFYAKSKPYFGGYVLLVFLLLVYLTASWHDWTFGCSYGMRNSVEYLSLFLIPFIYLIGKIWYRKEAIYITLKGSIILILLISFKLGYHYAGCYFDGNWNWEGYLNYLTYPL
jgi:hypothetical protein